ncbi:E3 ubiquitin-protein ligase RBBP6-like isoform X2 [Trematomus bernacchii]|uniref:E3 ubiquitin-protein ligase RBBP6-like isoform X2 n=1 Tax=Trematomus bernacchii TaxID=40690 RepID=UPI00146D0E81|nr:E3 ubiquitin-protein ligase RBBP6-like isoform X2 [Trematomus bernacchii]
MTHVHYKFSSKLSYDTVVFDGLHVTLRDLKRQIMGREKLRAGDCDLQITNAQNKEEFTDDDGSIPKGSSVIVRRIPIVGGKPNSSKTRNLERSDILTNNAFGAFKAMDDLNSSRALPLFSKMANLADVEGSEEDKIRVMMNQTGYDPTNYSKKPGTVLPANYTCYRCGGSGHHIRNCPSTADKNQEAPVKIKKSSGIPRSFMMEVDDPSVKGAMLTSCGRYAVPTIDAEAYAIGKKERPPFVPRDHSESEDEEDPVPEELLCLICHDLLSDAVVIPCCGNSYCDDCIRSALLDSEDHVCPTCSQSDVSPDNLIANKFLRQAVDTFKKERGFTKSLKKGCSASQSQNPTPTLSPALTPPPLTVQIQPQKPLLLNHRQQDPLRQHSQAADTPPSSQVPTSPVSTPNTPSTSCQPVQSHLETSEKEAEEKTDDDSAAAVALSAPVSSEELTDAPSQLIPLVNLTPEAELPQTSRVNQQQPSSDPPPRPSGPPTCWESSSSSSGCPPGGWTELNTQQRPPSSSPYPATPPPLFPPPHFHTFLTAPPPLSPYPPGYPPAIWTLPNLPGAPIAPLCPSTSIPALIPKEWYMQRKKERSPHRGSSHRRPSSGSHSKSSKSKSARSYSRSSSRSRSRSRSQGRSRPHSPYSHHREPHPRSTSSRSYCYGYKRSPTPSSSSSPQVGYHSRSRSPSDHSRNSRHQSRTSVSGSYDSGRRGEHHPREAGSHMYDPHVNQSSGMDQERFLQWKREYKEWCDKYFSSYVGHFHQMPIPLLSLPHPPQWGDREGSKNYSHANSDSRNRVQGRRSARMDKRSPQSSSDSRSPPSQSSRDSRSTPSQTSSDNRSSPSHSSNNSRSPHSQSSSDGRSTPSEDRALLKTYERRRTEKNSRRPITPPKSSEEPQEKRKDEKRILNRNLVKHEQKTVKKLKEEGVEKSSSPDSTDDRKGKRGHKTGPNPFKDGSQGPERATANNALEPVQKLVKPAKRLDKDYERKGREQRSLDKGKERRRGEHSDSRRDARRSHQDKPSKESGRVDRDRYRDPEGKRASGLENMKRKRENTERDSVKAQSSKCRKDPETRSSESPITFERNKTEKKKERKTWPLAEKDIWEGGIQMKPQKKISININLEGKKSESENLHYLESVTGKIKRDFQAGDGEEERLNRGETHIEENKETSRDMEEVSEDKRQKWEKATFRDDEGELFEKKQETEKENFDLWHSFCREVEEEKESEKHPDERDMMEASKGEEVTNEEMKLVASTSKEIVEGESTSKENIENLPAESKSKDELMELLNWRIMEEQEQEQDMIMSNSQSSKYKSHHDRLNTMVDDDSCEDHQAMKTVLKTLEELSQDIAGNQEDELVLTQVPHSKWEKEDSEEYQLGKGAIKVQNDAPEMYLPSPSVSVTTETSVEIDRRTEKDQTPILSSSQRRVAPSSGKDRTDRDEEKRMERRRDRERGRESDKSRDRQKDRNISKERRREGEKERDRERERSHKSNPPSSSYSTSHDMERRDKLSKKAPVLPDQNVHKTFIDTLLDSSFKENPHFYNNHPEKGGRGLEEMERPSSNSTSSSASQENGRGDARKEKKKQKKHKKEKREASPELCEEEGLKRQKKKTSKQSRDGEEEEISGDVDETMLMLSLLS